MDELSSPARVRALRSLNALDVEADVWSHLMAQVAQDWFCAPMVSITLVEADRQWRVASCGPLEREGPLEGAICPVAMHAPGVFVVDDTTTDPRFADSPYVVGAPWVRFYAGWPLRAPGGEPLGSFCVMDTRPRQFTDADRKALEYLGRWVQEELHVGVAAAA